MGTWGKTQGAGLWWYTSDAGRVRPFPAGIDDPDVGLARLGTLADVMLRQRTEDVVGAWLGLQFPSPRRAMKMADWKPDEIETGCYRCGKSVGPGEETTAGCAHCRGTKPAYGRVVRLGRYGDDLRDWVIQAKYEGWGEMSRELGLMLGDRVKASRCIEPDRVIVVPVPMPWQRRLYRGLDHARIMAGGVASILGVDVFVVLTKVNGPTQVRLSATERQRNLRNRIRIKRRIGGWPLGGLQVVLVDDVRTTGATLQLCARLLKQLGVARVVAAVAGVVDDPSRRGVDAAPTHRDGWTVEDLEV